MGKRKTSKNPNFEIRRKSLLQTYNHYGNTICKLSTYEKIKDDLGKHTKRLLKADLPYENDCYVIERVE